LKAASETTLDSDGAEPFDDFPMPVAGELLEGRYRVGARIARGGMGVVHEAVHVELGRRSAIKFVRSELAGSERALGRFQREARLLGGMRHDNIAEVYDIGRYAGKTPFIVMEFLDGHTLREELDRHGPLELERALGLLRQACLAVAYAHERGVVHRDLKPENLMLTPSSEGAERVKLLDFGIAQSPGPADGRLTPTGATLGTSHYMSPEQARGETQLEPASDVYSLGVILYELVSGERPHGGSSFAEALFQRLTRPPTPLEHYLPSCPRAVLELVGRCLRPQPAERYPDAGKLLGAVEACLEELESARAPESQAPVARPPARARRAGLSAAVTVLLAVAASLVFARQNSELRRELLRAEAALRASSVASAEGREAPVTVSVPAASASLAPEVPSSRAVAAGSEPLPAPSSSVPRATGPRRVTREERAPSVRATASSDAPPPPSSLGLPFVSRNPYE
jgi:serine/threonine protein kinase